MDTPALNGNEGTQNRQKSSDVSLILQGTSEKATAIFYSRKAMILDTEAAVIANFEFLGHTDMDMEEEEGDGEDQIYDAITDKKLKNRHLVLFIWMNEFFKGIYYIEDYNKTQDTQIIKKAVIPCWN
ncbi:uncharacterized protein LOC112588990 [Harpegnathos saltator]|uniref:uncharacterized protein LOC112588990 n=1 Tax=Harpegnathos saltator TaxID=610380 RepID=UPI000DBEE8E8|nr:uncharacterized protein LOC112588990 [Harpegnathos saltator]